MPKQFNSHSKNRSSTHDRWRIVRNAFSHLQRGRLGRILVTAALIKIVFLAIFWQLVLKHQFVRVDAADMSDRIMPAPIENKGGNDYGKL